MADEGAARTAPSSILQRRRSYVSRMKWQNSLVGIGDQCSTCYLRSSANPHQSGTRSRNPLLRVTEQRALLPEQDWRTQSTARSPVLNALRVRSALGAASGTCQPRFRDQGLPRLLARMGEMCAPGEGYQRAQGGCTNELMLGHRNANRLSLNPADRVLIGAARPS
jgi:hypothetical protein